MTRDQLEQAIRASCNVAEDHEVYVFGSQAILGAYPDAHPALRMSIEVDIAPVNKPERAINIEGAMGELSRFSATHGFYVQGVEIATATLPAGWRRRLISVCNENTFGKTGRCLEPHDLAASKLAAYRPKDLDYVRVLLAEKMVIPRTLVKRITTLPIDEDFRLRLLQWVHLTVQELQA